MLSLGACRFDALPLPLLDGRTFLLRYRAEDFNENVVNHLQHPFLPDGEIGHRCWEVNDFYADTMLLEVLQLRLDVALVAAQTVKRFHNEGITGSEHRRFQRLIPCTVEILTGFLVCNDVALRRT